MMARRKRRLRQVFRHTAQELRKWSKARLIRLILRLEAARVSRTGKRRMMKVSRRRVSKRKLSAGVHIVRIKGKPRRVRVNARGQWKFLKGKARRNSSRRRRSKRRSGTRRSRRR